MLPQMTVEIALYPVTLDLRFSLHALSCSSYTQETESSYCIISHSLFFLHASFFLLMMFCICGFPFLLLNGIINYDCELIRFHRRCFTSLY